MTTPSFYTNAFVKGNKVFSRAIENGLRSCRTVSYEPTLYIPDSTSTDDWKSITGTTLKAIKFDDVYAAKDFLKQYENVDGMKIYGLPRFVYAYLREKYPNHVDYDSSYIRTVYLDIEVNSGNGFPHVDACAEEITAITAKDASGYHSFGCGVFVSDGKIPNLTYTKCVDEHDLLLKFLDFWTCQGQDHPDVITGWNVKGFDIPYLTKRIASVLGIQYANKLSPWGIISERKAYDDNGNDLIIYDIAGISTLDYIELYKKFTYKKQERYKLDHIATVELGEKKIDFSDYQTLHTLYLENFQLYMEYNIADVVLVERLEQKMQLLEQAFTIAYDAKVNFEDVFMQVRLWDVMIHNYLFDRRIAVPSSGGGKKDESFVGAYVKDPLIGKHKWIMSVDAKALYPNLIQMFNISPETILNECHSQLTVDDILKGKEPSIIDGKCLAPNGWLFNTEFKGFLPEMMEKLLVGRDSAKANMIQCQKDLEIAITPEEKLILKNAISKWNNLQSARKVQLNAAFGACGNEHFRYFDLRLATAITLSGQLIIKYSEQEINCILNEYMQTDNYDYVIASDTDSLYLKMELVVERILQVKPNLSNDEIANQLDKFSKKVINPAFLDMFSRLSKRLGAIDGHIFMKREAIADAGIWTGKKHYILNVLDNEGVRYAKPKLKMMGIEAIKSSTPKCCRTAIIKSIEIILSGTETDVQKYIEDFRLEFNKLPFEDIAFPRGVSNVEKYESATKSVPIAVRGSLAFNALLVIYGLEKRFDSIKDGEKIRFCYLKMPNPIQSNVISAIRVLPDEFGLSPYLDYDLQFEKAFVTPISSILNVIGWEAEHTATLDSFFS